MTVPAAFRARGDRPERAKAICRVCGLPYLDHSGDVCSICRDNVEHHAPGAFDGCLAGRQRLARARQAAGIELDEVDRVALTTAR